MLYQTDPPYDLMNWFLLLLMIYYVMMIVSSRTRDPEIESSSLLLAYGILGFNSLFIGSVFTEIVINTPPINFIFYNFELPFIAIIQFVLIITGLILFIAYSAKNSNKFGYFLLVCSILLLVELLVMLPINIIIFISVLTETSTFLDSIIRILISAMIVSMAMIFLVIHGFQNKDFYMIIGGFLYIGGTFIWVILHAFL